MLNHAVTSIASVLCFLILTSCGGSSNDDALVSSGFGL